MALTNSLGSTMEDGIVLIHEYVEPASESVLNVCMIYHKTPFNTKLKTRNEIKGQEKL
jgi:hypothetical protein